MEEHVHASIALAVEAMAHRAPDCKEHLLAIVRFQRGLADRYGAAARG